MKQLVAHLRSGAIRLAETPAPTPGATEILVRSHLTLISPGTERMLVHFGRSSLIGKARQQPDRVAQALDKARTDGWMAAWDAVSAKLDRSIPLGYSQVGRIAELGREAAGARHTGFAVGRRVVANGSHAEWNAVPRNLCALVPDAVTDEQAAFTVLGAIALEGLRRAAPSLGECFLVSGLGLVGLLAAQLLRAAGCRVLAADFNAARLELAGRFGAEPIDLSQRDLRREVEIRTGGVGVDGALVATAASSAAPLVEAARASRHRGRVVLVGTAKIDIPREEFYQRELKFEVSCSYGPGRYDRAYEHGADYPLGHVRWTARRNFEAVLALMAEGKLELEPLISHRFPFDQAEQAYALLVEGAPSLGILLGYPEAGPAAPAAAIPAIHVKPRPGAVGIGFIGAGNYARRTLIPAFAANERAHLAGICSPSGLPAAEAARQFGFAMAASEARCVIEHPDVAAVVIATPHGAHAALVEQALAAGKHVFVEKPLAVSYAQVARIERAAHEAPGQVLVTGFNRRFAPLTLALRDRLGRLSGPRAFLMTVNAGRVDPGHWASEERIVGEACHFIDLLRFLAAAPVETVDASRLGTGERALESASIHLRFADGSIGTVHYFTEGHRGFAKERLEVFAGGAVLTLDNFRRLVCFGAEPLRAWPFARQDKGQAGLVDAFLKACAGQAPPPIPLEEQFEVARVTLEAAGEAL